MPLSPPPRASKRRATESSSEGDSAPWRADRQKGTATEHSTKSSSEGDSAPWRANRLKRSAIVRFLYLDVYFLAGHFQIVPSPKLKMRNIEFRILGTFGGHEIVLHAPKQHSNDHNSAAIRFTELILCMVYTSRPARNSWDRSRGRSSSVDRRK